MCLQNKPRLNRGQKVQPPSGPARLPAAACQVLPSPCFAAPPSRATPQQASQPAPQRRCRKPAAPQAALHTPAWRATPAPARGPAPALKAWPGMRPGVVPPAAQHAWHGVAQCCLALPHGMRMARQAPRHGAAPPAGGGRAGLVGRRPRPRGARMGRACRQHGKACGSRLLARQRPGPASSRMLAPLGAPGWGSRLAGRSARSSQDASAKFRTGARGQRSGLHAVVSQWAMVRCERRHPSGAGLVLHPTA